MSGMDERPVVVLAGGVGGARLAHGLQAHLGEDLVVIVNTADDLERHGLEIWPDHDTVLYTLAGLDDRERGWGLRDETWATMDGLERLGEATWFRLGDRDLATHLLRTEQLRSGRRGTEVALDLRRRLRVAATILPMTDARVRTIVRTDDGWLPFQDYFVRLGQAPEVREVRFEGIGHVDAVSPLQLADQQPFPRPPGPAHRVVDDARQQLVRQQQLQGASEIALKGHPITCLGPSG